MAPHRNSVLESWHSDPLSDVANAGLPWSPIVPVQPAEHYWSPSESEITATFRQRLSARQPLDRIDAADSEKQPATIIGGLPSRVGQDNATRNPVKSRLR